MLGPDRALEGSTQLLALVPGIIGQYLRRAFLSRVLAGCHHTATIEFGTLFSAAGARLDEHVYVGPRCHLGFVHLEREVLVAAGVHIPSGAHIHGSGDAALPLREQGLNRTLVTIGEGSWIGSAAVVMADVGARTIIGAGSVVTRPVPDDVIAAGSPARVIRSRTSGQPTRDARMRLPQLDFLRAVAVLMVIASHLPQPPSTVPAPIAATAVFFRMYGSLGVDLFFVLSGFLVAGLLFREVAQRGSIRIGRFLIRRGLKIYPAFYAFIGLSVAARIAYGDHIAKQQIWAELLFVQNYFPGVWTHTWSLAVEEHFYLLLAALFLLLARGRSPNAFRTLPAIFLVTALIVCLWRSWLIATSEYSVYTHRFPTHVEIDALLFGVLLAYWWNTFDAVRQRAREYRLWTLLGGASVLAASLWLPGPGISYVVGHVLTYVGFGLILIGAVSLPVHGISGLGRGLRAIEYVGAHWYLHLPVAYRGPRLRHNRLHAIVQARTHVQRVRRR